MLNPYKQLGCLSVSFDSIYQCRGNIKKMLLDTNISAQWMQLQHQTSVSNHAFIAPPKLSNPNALYLNFSFKPCLHKTFRFNVLRLTASCSSVGSGSPAIWYCSPMLKFFVAVPCGSKFKLFVLMSRFKVFVWIVIASPTAVLAAAVACSKTCVAEAWSVRKFTHLDQFVDLLHLLFFACLRISQRASNWPRHI